MQSFKNQKIWIIGASTGIGRSLAQDLAKQGAKLVLSARSVDKLNSLEAELGVGHWVLPVDVEQLDSCQKAVAFIDKEIGYVDRVIFLPATHHFMSLRSLNISEVEKIIKVNLNSVFYFLKSIESWLTLGKLKQLAFCASVAGYNGLRKGQPYCCTKAAMINLLEGLRTELYGEVDVKIINPGFVKTPLTEGSSYPMPMVISSEQAAINIRRGLQRKGFEIHFPKAFTYLLKFLRITPYWLYFFIIRKAVR